MRTLLAIIICTLGIGLTADNGSAQSTETTSYTTVQAERGKAVRIGYHASAHTATCTGTEPPAVRVLDAPDAGALAVQTGNLTTEKISGCPRITIPVRVLFYTAGRAAADHDHVVYEVTNADGKVITYDVRINIKAGEAQPARSGIERKT